MQKTLINHQLIRAIRRTQLAFDRYVGNCFYYDALKIFKANERIYEILNEFIYLCDEDLYINVVEYIFHLEDWFEQFKELEKTNPKLENKFVFNRFIGSPAFPKDILTKLAEKKS